MKNLERAAKAAAIAEAAADRKAEDIVTLDVSEVASFADTFVIATGTSDRHVRSVADAIRDAMSALGEDELGIEGYDDGLWVLIDYADTIVHVFQHDTRIQYDLERLWSDGSKLEFIGSDSPPQQDVQ